MLARLQTLTVVSLLGLLSAGPAFADIEDARAAALAYLVSNQQGDGTWEQDGLAMAATASALEAMRNAGMASSPMYAKAVAWMANAEAGSTDSLSRQISSLAAVGQDVQPLGERLLEWRNGNVYSVGSTGQIGPSWGAYASFQGSFPDTPLALEAIIAADIAFGDMGTALGYVIGEQNTDGGWAYLRPSTATPASRLVPTAHGVIALSEARSRGWGVGSQAGNGAAWLKTKQLADGGFADDPSATSGSALETALAVQALEAAEAAGVTSATSEIAAARQFLVDSQAPDGSWPGGVFATAAAVAALPAVSLSDTDDDGVPDVVETRLGSDANLADARDWVSGNGDSVSGVTTAVQIDLGALGSSIANQYLPADAGAVAWVVLSGNLPDGVSLNALTGELSGIGGTAGTYNITYRVTYPDGSSELLIAQLNVASAVEPKQVPLIPLPGMLMLAALMGLLGGLLSMHRTSKEQDVV